MNLKSWQSWRAAPAIPRIKARHTDLAGREQSVLAGQLWFGRRLHVHRLFFGLRRGGVDKVDAMRTGCGLLAREAVSPGDHGKIGERSDDPIIFNLPCWDVVSREQFLCFSHLPPYSLFFKGMEKVNVMEYLNVRKAAPITAKSKKGAGP